MISPDETREYSIQTFGQSDTVMVLFVDEDGDPRFVAGDDDSGASASSRLDVRLYKGKTYVVRIRMFFDNSAGKTSVMMW